MQVHAHTLALTVCTYMRRLHTLTLIQIHIYTHVCVSGRRHTDRPSVHLPVYLSVCLSVCLGCFSLSVCRFVCLSTYESFYLYFFFLSVFWTVSLFVCMSMPLQSQEAMSVFQAPCICWISHRFIPLDIKLSGFLPPLWNSRERQPGSRAVCGVSEVQYRGIPTKEF